MWSSAASTPVASSYLISKAAELGELRTRMLSVDFRASSKDHNCDIDYLYSNILYVKEFRLLFGICGSIGFCGLAG
jgi:hypothetical protein